MLVSICIVAYNEEEYLPSLLDEVCDQTYPHSLMELILVDSMSTDNTKAVMERFREGNNDFHGILLLDNSKRRLAPGWNRAIASATGDVIIRIDAHASIPQDFVQRNVIRIMEGESISGGQRPNIIDGDSPWKRTLLAAENAAFGSGIAPYRRSTQKRYVKTMFHAAYKREVFQVVGGLNENLGRTEDNELHYRMRQAGYRLCFDPDIISFQYTRNSLKGMVKQKFLNGYWIGLTIGVCPGCFSLYHFVPLGFVGGIMLTGALWLLGFPMFAALMWGTYWITCFVMSVLSIAKEEFNICLVALPIVFFLLHISYGVGTLLGLIKMPHWVIHNKDCEAVEQVKRALRSSSG